MVSTPCRCRLPDCRRLVFQALGVAQPATATRTPCCSSLCEAMGEGRCRAGWLRRGMLHGFSPPFGTQAFARLPYKLARQLPMPIDEGHACAAIPVFQKGPRCHAIAAVAFAVQAVMRK